MNIIAAPIFLVLIIIAFLIFAYRISKSEKKRLLNELWIGKKITDDTYKEYLDK